MNRLSKTNI